MTPREQAGAIAVEVLSAHDADLLDRLRIEWKPRLTSTAGRAHVTKATIHLSTPILTNVDAFDLRQTVVHELAHLHAFERHQDRGHGQWWQRTMRNWGLEPRRRHSLHKRYAAVRAATGYTIKISCPKCGRCDYMAKQRARGFAGASCRDCSVRFEVSGMAQLKRDMKGEK